MFRGLSVIILFVFVSWLLPLGIFIKPSQEKIACDGQRAICMCSHSGGALASKSRSGETVVKFNPGAHKEEHGSFSASQYYFATNHSNKNSHIASLHFLRQLSLYQLLICHLIDHVPKV